MRKIFYKIGSCLVAVLCMHTLASCDDWFTLTPESDMVAEDFWRDKKDVQSALGACYRTMIENDFVSRLIVWGEMRSDNVAMGYNMGENETDLMEASIKATNGYASWTIFYRTINYCNAVIENAPGVRDRDPNFSEAELNACMAEAKTIRAFCYFTLVRTFKDIPFVTIPYLDDSQLYETKQTAGDDILRSLIEDLKTVEEYASIEYSENVEHTKGRVTQKALWTLMADMYLWLNDYANCVTYCDKVLETTSNPVALLRGSNYFNPLYSIGNSDESVWELQFDINTPNYTVRNFYGSSDNVNPYLTSADFETMQGEMTFSVKDLRRRNAFFRQSGKCPIMKYTAVCSDTEQDLSKLKLSDFTYGDYTKNWILYRLADLYLMKAEALVEMDGAANIAEAVSLVSKTYDRANPDLEENSLSGNSYSQSSARNLVFDERQREFLFEGKRYFDIVRRIRREGTATAVVRAYLIPKFNVLKISESTALSRLDDMDAIYMPISESELRLNTLLVQNRFYMVSSDISKK